MRTARSMASSESVATRKSAVRRSPRRFASASRCASDRSTIDRSEDRKNPQNVAPAQTVTIVVAATKSRTSVSRGRVAFMKRA